MWITHRIHIKMPLGGKARPIPKGGFTPPARRRVGRGKPPQEEEETPYLEAEAFKTRHHVVEASRILESKPRRPLET
jgi:hypothetical protein